VIGSEGGEEKHEEREDRERKKNRGPIASKEVNVASAILRGGSCFQRSQPASAIRDPTPP